MTSAIDPTKPIEGTPTTESVRDNFQFAKDEIEALQALAPAKRDESRVGGFLRKALQANEYWVACQNNLCAALTTIAMASGTLRVIPFCIPRDGLLSVLGLEITTGGAGNLDMGLYAVNPAAEWEPGALLSSHLNVSAVATGLRSWNPNLQVKAGEVYFLALAQNVSVTFHGLTAPNCFAFWPPTGTTAAHGRNIATTIWGYSAMPSSLIGALAAITQATVPFVCAKIT